MDVPRVLQDRGPAGLQLERWERNVAVAGLVAALCALPLPPIGSGPEIASTLAVCSVIALAGVRWAIALVVATEALLIATFWPFVIAGDGEHTLRLLGAVSGLATLPGLWSIGRAAPHMLELFGLERSPNAARAAQRVLAAGALVVIALPLF
jgi:hypothetical protein